MLGRSVTQGELTHFLRRVISGQSVVLPQISRLSRQFPVVMVRSFMN